MQTESGRLLERRRRVKPDAVVADHELERGPVMLQDHAHRSCLGMPRHIRQRLLQNPIHGRLDQRGQPARDSAFHTQVDRHPERFGKVIHVPPRGRHEPLVVQDGGMQAAGQPPDVIHRLRGNFLQPLRGGADLRDRGEVPNGPKPHQEARERLAGLVMQLARDAPALIILRGDQALHQSQARGVGSLAVGQVGDDRHENDVTVSCRRSIPTRMDPERHHGERNPHRRRRRTVTHHGELARAIPRGTYELRQTGALRRRHELVESGAAQTLERFSRDLSEATVCKQNRSIGEEERGAVVHGIEEDVIRMCGTLDGARLLAAGTCDDQGVHLTGADRLQRRFGLGQPGPQSHGGTPALRRSASPLHDVAGDRGRRSSPTRARSVLDRSPTSLRIGSGSLRTRVGSARI